MYLRELLFLLQVSNLKWAWLHLNHKLQDLDKVLFQVKKLKLQSLWEVAAVEVEITRTS
jgi:hypothetical protein